METNISQNYYKSLDIISCNFLSKDIKKYNKKSVYEYLKFKRINIIIILLSNDLN